MEEIWKDITGYEGMYQVSSLGRVKSLERVIATPFGNKLKCEIIFKHGYGGFMYRQVSLHKNGIPKTYKIHRLVAMAFIPNPENKYAVNHISGDKEDNSLFNLEWNTSSENQLHAYAKKLRNPSFAMLGKTGEKCPTSKSVLQFDKNGVFIRKFGSTREAERQLGIRNIYACAVGKRRTIGGYIWKYEQ